MNYNYCALDGNLVADPEIRVLPNSTTVCNFTIAFNNPRKNSDTGEWDDRPTFIDCQAFGSITIKILEGCSKGDWILIESRLDSDRWTNEEGKNRSKHKLVVQKVHLLTPKRNASETSHHNVAVVGQSEDHHQNSDDDIPF